MKSRAAVRRRDVVKGRDAVKGWKAVSARGSVVGRQAVTGRCNVAGVEAVKGRDRLGMKREYEGDTVRGTDAASSRGRETESRPCLNIKEVRTFSEPGRKEL